MRFLMALKLSWYVRIQKVRAQRTKIQISMAVRASEVCPRLIEPWIRVDNSDQTVGYLIETDEFYSKLPQNVENFQPNLLPNLADSCIFRKNELRPVFKLML